MWQYESCFSAVESFTLDLKAEMPFNNKFQLHWQPCGLFGHRKHLPLSLCERAQLYVPKSYTATQISICLPALVSQHLPLIRSGWINSQNDFLSPKPSGFLFFQLLARHPFICLHNAINSTTYGNLEHACLYYLVLLSCIIIAAFISRILTY